MGAFDFTEDLIKITEFKLAGKLPNPFVFDDGTAVTDPAQWPARKAEIWEKAVTLQFGQMPPKPEFLEVEPIYLSPRVSLTATASLPAVGKNPSALPWCCLRPTPRKRRL